MTKVFAIDYCENGYRMNDIRPSSSVVKNIKIDTNDNIPSSWRNALELTVLELNNKFNHIDIGIQYQLVRDGSHDTFIYWESFYDLGLQLYTSEPAYADEPTYNNVGKKIILNSTHFEEIYSEKEKKSILIHELFHNLGVRNTNSIFGQLVPLTDQSPICDNTKWGRSIMEENAALVSMPNSVDYYVLRKFFPK